DELLNGVVHDVASDEPRITPLAYMIIRDATLSEKKFFRIDNGRIEQIIDNKNEKSRDALIWQNLFFGKRIIKKVKHPDVFMASNSPLFNYPEIIDDVLKYVIIPKPLANEYRKQIKKNS
ncbi:hypothetical protein, partial [Marinobacterium weihaiense]